MYTLIFIIVCYGITSIVVEGSLFYELIEKTNGRLHELLSCKLCFSTWVGFIVGSVILISGNWTPISEFTVLPIWLEIFACGMLSAGGVWIIEKITE